MVARVEHLLHRGFGKLLLLEDEVSDFLAEAVDVLFEASEVVLDFYVEFGLE